VRWLSSGMPRFSIFGGDMPSTEKGWTIAGYHECGTLIHADGRRIDFGTKGKFDKVSNRVDLRFASHGENDTAAKALACFIAAADLISEDLKKGGHHATVHCDRGNSRTAFALIVFLTRHEGFSYDEAAAFVTKGQSERTDINFSLSRQVNNRSYHEWLRKEENSLKQLENRDRYRATNVSFAIVKGKNQVIHFVQANRSINIEADEQRARKRKRRSADEIAGQEATAFLKRKPKRALAESRP
jgi:hypothetical protein